MNSAKIKAATICVIILSDVSCCCTRKEIIWKEIIMLPDDLLLKITRVIGLLGLAIA